MDIHYPSQSDESNKDKRRHPRFQSRRLVRFLLDNGDELKSIFKIINVSQGGLQFACRDKLNVDTQLRLQIEEEETKQLITLKARVAWLNPDRDANGLYYSGVTFLDMQDDARALVLKALA